VPYKDIVEGIHESKFCPVNTSQNTCQGNKIHNLLYKRYLPWFFDQWLKDTCYHSLDPIHFPFVRMLCVAWITLRKMLGH
jgi:hypothetical protein